MRRTRLALLSLSMVAAVAVVATVPAAGDSSPTTFTYNAGMNGAKEVPDPGDKDASGHARITVDTGTGEICWELQVRRIDGAVTAAHIHVGDRRTAGGVVQALSPPTGGTSSGCATNEPVADAIVTNPHGYYVNVHSDEFPAGAVRGQLAGRHG